MITTSRHEVFRLGLGKARQVISLLHFSMVKIKAKCDGNERGKIKAEKCNFFEFSSRVMLGLFENSVDSHQHSAPLLPYPLTTKRKTMEFIVCFTF